MPINPNLFTHDSDKAALTALKAIPGFSQLMKAFMNIGYEKQARIMNMGDNLRVNEKQLPKYYHMLLPICEKLGIKVPELYVELNVNPNAYTSGDTNPYIVITSGMLELIPDDLIPTVLAHECGHIVCRHNLYSMMGREILRSAYYASSFMPHLLGSAITNTLQLSFAYWMRCSELSADRVAAFCDGSPDKMIQLCMYLSGYDKDFFGVEPSVEEFLAQVDDYRELASDGAWNKTLEFLWMRNRSHPQCVIRAYECNEWAKSPQFEKIVRYLGAAASGRFTDESGAPVEAPMPEDSKSFVGRETDAAVKALAEAGFANIRIVRTMEKGTVSKDGLVVEVLAAGSPFRQLDWFPADTEITVTYYKAMTEEEDAAAHPGMIRMPESASRFAGQDYLEVTRQLAAAGFTNMIAVSQPIRIALFTREGSVAEISADGDAGFAKGAWFAPDALIRITYYTSAP